VTDQALEVSRIGVTHPYARVSHAREAGYLQSRWYSYGLSGYPDKNKLFHVKHIFPELYNEKLTDWY